jgi:hypothetical protein
MRSAQIFVTRAGVVGFRLQQQLAVERVLEGGF